MPERQEPLRDQIASILRSRSGSPVEQVADELYSAVEQSITVNVEAFERIVTAHCAKRHARKGPAPCSECGRRITIARTIQTSLLPPNPVDGS